jgi:hypothetical protein
MRPARLAIAALIALVGIVWTGQGLGFIGGSFMTGSGFWAAAGLVLLVVAAVVALAEWRRRPPG